MDPVIFKAAEKYLCEERYSHFFRAAWSVIEPDTRLIWNWHLELLCDIFQEEIIRIAEKIEKTKDVVVNVPPRSLKSSVISIFLNAWAWTKFPHLKFITSSYSADLAELHALRTRMLIESDWFQGYWPLLMRRDQNQKSAFENTSGGYRIAVGVGGSVMGMGADVLIVDDPIQPLQALSEIYIKRTKIWWDHTFQTRLNDHRFGLRIIVMQRLHEDDLTGHVLNKAPKKWRPIVIPAEDSFPIEPENLRKHYRRGSFFTQKFSRKVLEEHRTNLGSIGYASQMGQSPRPLDGSYFNKKWFNRYLELPDIEYPRYIQSWDLSIKDDLDSSYAVGLTFVTDGKNHYLVDVVRRKMAYRETRSAMLLAREKYPDVSLVLVEDKANGSPIINDLQNEILEIEAVSKTRGKKECAQLAAVTCEKGLVIIPEGDVGDEFIRELLAFPNSRYDDQVDAFCQYILEVTKTSAYNPDGMVLS